MPRVYHAKEITVSAKIKLKEIHIIREERLRY